MPEDPPERPEPKRGRRRIGPEERDLWRRAMRDAVPLTPAERDPLRSGTAVPPPEAPPAAPTSPAPDAPRDPRILRPTGPGRTGRPNIDLAQPGPGPVGRPEPGLDRRNAERLRRGQREPDGRIDLHGMTAERAHRALDRYIGAALAQGQRLVLVITGKGGKRRGQDDAPFMRGHEGVLRQQAPKWLRAGPHARGIVGIYEAHQRHGGVGAFYVYLKRQR